MEEAEQEAGTDAVGAPRVIAPRSGSSLAGGSGAFFDPTRPYELVGVGVTEARILEAARQCLIRLGSTRTTMADVARVARLSRPTVYKYFPDRAALLSAVVGHGIVAHDNDVIEAMSIQDSLDRQLAAVVTVSRKWTHAARQLSFITDEELALFRGDPLITERGFERIVELITPYVERAEVRGEVRSDLDIPLAAEWLVRVVGSLATEGRHSLDVDDFETLRSFVHTFVINGLR
jgi:AcrR family transcriptional regulator